MGRRRTRRTWVALAVQFSPWSCRVVGGFSRSRRPMMIVSAWVRRLARPTGASVRYITPFLAGKKAEWEKSPLHDETSPEYRAELEALVAQYDKEQSEKKVKQQKEPPMRRTGIIALKVGMMGMYDASGEKHPVTLLHVDNCHVLQVKSEPNSRGLVGIQIGAGHRKPKNCPKSMIGHAAKAGLEPHRKLVEFPVHPSATLPTGTQLNVTHFVAGQLIDIQGITNGKGFAGAMKRWGFKGQRATHGTSISHRSLGSTGNRQDPGRTWKGKKMAGHMGCKKRTQQCVKILRIDPERNLIYVRGSIPGRKGNWVTIRDAVRRPKQLAGLPIPTNAPESLTAGETFAPTQFFDEFAPKVSTSG
ncbi:Large ribosomal subunit protein uL3c [Plasmodiophora brassicae]|uniref:Large ribosomal subunit protein uL3m n=1 Tax=Plasmodiophora brassicae TaxID=37360 RepID=A0A3P3YF09_PLABS|nr:unnamed protein product [Plasmodiophora brassicae]